MKNTSFFALRTTFSNLLLIVFSIFIISSCNPDILTNPIDKTENQCKNSEGFISAKIDGKQIYNECLRAPALTTSQASFWIGGFDQISVTTNNANFDDFLSIFVINLQSKDLTGACISSKGDSTGLNDILETQFVSITYLENLNINLLAANNDSNADSDGIYNSYDGEFKVCIEQFDTESGGKLIGTFSGMLKNEEGTTKEVTDGRFEFEIQ